MASRDQVATKPITGHQKNNEKPTNPSKTQSIRPCQPEWANGCHGEQPDHEYTSAGHEFPDTLVQILPNDPTKRHDKIEMQLAELPCRTGLQTTEKMQPTVIN